MKRADVTQPSSLGQEAVLRIGRNEADVLFAHMRQNPRKEQMAFGLASRARTAEGTTLIVNELILPDRKDLCEQSAACVCPSKKFQSYVYFRALQSGSSIVEYHTHPSGARPVFSGTDDRYAHKNGEYIRREIPEPITLAMVVGNDRFDAFDGVVYDRVLGHFRELNRLEILGRPCEIHDMGARRDDAATTPDARYDRQARIPGWNQQGLEKMRVSLAGLGGNGAPILETLVGIGVGRCGFLALIDPDTVELSNLPRLPYALPEQVGTPKVTAAAHHAGRKSPETPVYPFPCSVSEKAVRDRMKMSNVILGCGDNDGMRMALNEISVRYRMPYIDLGCDIQVSEDSVVAGGQVRVVLPGENACLVCCGGFDPAQAAFDQMDDRGQAQRAAAGYVQGTRATATPSVANLNGLTAHFAIAQLLALINGEQFGAWDYLHVDQLSGRTITAKTKRNPDCPLCGRDGCLGAGDDLMRERRPIPSLRRLDRRTAKEKPTGVLGREMSALTLPEEGE